MANTLVINGNLNLTVSQYNKLSQIIYDTAGINLGDNKKELVHARLSKILRKRNIDGFGEYLHILKNDTSGDELVNLLDAISTNVTHFFRENMHFDFLSQNFSDRGYKGSLRIWSAGCSSGEEPYTIAITLLENILTPGSPQPVIFATDISTKILNRAVSAVYPIKAIESIDSKVVKKYFLRGKNSNTGMVKVKKKL